MEIRYFFAGTKGVVPINRGGVDRSSYVPSLDRYRHPATILVSRPRTESTVFAPDQTVSAQRFERAIADRRYVIETTLVGPDRWRAYLVGVSGGPSALMPFYGETPEQAAERLADWLALAHRSSTLPYGTNGRSAGSRG